MVKYKYTVRSGSSYQERLSCCCRGEGTLSTCWRAINNGCLLPCKCRRSSRPKPKATPLPLLKLAVLCSALFVNQFGINMIFPFLPFMIHDFFPTLDKTELGHKAGYLASAYFIGNFMGSFAWGWISDRVGRRPVLLFGVAVTISCELLFGFSQNFAWAIIARFFWGLLNGNIGVAKTYISEICDDSNQAKGFAFVGTTGGIARLMGSVVGGFLARPASKYSVLQTEFFCKYPFALPCIVGSGISSISFLASWLFLDETLVKKADSDSNSRASDVSLESKINPHQQDQNDILEHDSAQDVLLMPDKGEDEIEQFELDDSESATDSEYDATSDTELIRTRNSPKQFILKKQLLKKCLETFSLIKLARKVMQRFTDCIGGFFSCILCIWSYNYSQCKPNNIGTGSSNVQKVLARGLWRTFKLLLDRKVIISISLYGMIAFLAIISNELLPLLLVTSHDHGGYNMDDSEIGIILMTAAIGQLLLQMFVFPRIAKCIGYRHTYKLGCTLFALSCILFPLSNKISGPVSYLNEGSGSGSGSASGMIMINSSDVGVDFCGVPSSDATVNADSVSRVPGRVWVVIMIITMLNVFSRVITITSVMVLISNSTLPENRGTVNGYGQSIAALGRILGPLTAAPLFAWSENSGMKWPLNYHFVFDLLTVGAIGAIALCFLLPASSEKKREHAVVTAVVDIETGQDHSVGVGEGDSGQDSLLVNEESDTGQVVSDTDQDSSVDSLTESQ